MNGTIMQPIKNGMRQPHRLAQRKADDGRDQDSHLLARRLERGVEALVAGRRNLGQIDRDAADLDTGGEALQQSTQKNDDRRHDPDARIGGTDRDQHRSHRHDRKGDDQPFAAADPIDIGAEYDGADGAHQRAQPERGKGQHQPGGVVPGRKEGFGDIGCIETEQEEIELLEKVAAGRPENGAEARFELRWRRTVRWRHH
jgi:hypothetical protein